MTDIPFGNPGQAGSETDSFAQYEVLLSDTPAFYTEDLIVAASQDLALYEVVGFDGSGNIVPADNGSAVDAIGITAGAIVTGVGENPTLQVIRGGHFNGDALVWDAAYDDDAKKIAAFRGAPAPTNILIAFNKYHRKP